MPDRTRAHRSALLLSVFAGATIAVTGCSRPDDQRTETVDPREVEQARNEWPAGVAAQVDSGNAAYRAGAFEASQKHFEEATRLGAEVPAAWFGLYMARHAMGNLAGADSALLRAQSLVPGATLLRHSERDTLR